MPRPESDREETQVRRVPAPRAPYRPPTLTSLGSAATITNAVSMRGLMDGFMMRRTG